MSSSSPKRNNIGNNNLIINLNINNNIQDFNVRNHRSYEKKNRSDIIDFIYEYFYSEREYKSFINQPQKFLNPLFLLIYLGYINFYQNAHMKK